MTSFNDTQSVTSVPPPYSERSGSVGHDLGQAPDYSSRHRTSVDSADAGPGIAQQTIAEEPASPSSRGNPFTRFRESLAEKKEEREKQRMIKHYEKKYGFVPKNVMTEPEWKKAQKSAPVVRKKTEWGKHTMFGPENATHKAKSASENT